MSRRVQKCNVKYFGEWVYFIECQCENRYVKIGYAGNPKERLLYMQVGNPYRLKLVGVIRGGREVEAQIHADLAGTEVGGEWFRQSDKLRTYLKQAMDLKNIRRAIPSLRRGKDRVLAAEQKDDVWLIVDQISGRVVTECFTRREAEYTLKRLQREDRA